MAANDRRSEVSVSSRKPITNGAPSSVEMVSLERDPSYYNNEAFTVYEDIDPTKSATSKVRKCHLTFHTTQFILYSFILYKSHLLSFLCN